MRQPCGIDLVPDQGQIEQGSGHDLVLDHSTLAEVQAARAHPGDGFRALHGDFLLPLLVVVAEFVFVGGDGVLDRQQDVLPDVCRGIFQIDHDGGRSGVQQLHGKLAIVGGAGHLVALIGAPVGHFDAPVGSGRLRGGQIIWRVSAVRHLQHLGTSCGQLLLPRGELFVKR